MGEAGSKRDCLALIGFANSFRLGHSYLGSADTRAKALAGDAAMAIRAKVAQGRVLTFAAMVRAEEWLDACADFAVPANLAADPRYAPPVGVSASEFTEAANDLREAAAVNLAAAVGAASSRDCKRVAAAEQALDLFVPFVEKLMTDLRRRPEAQGPRASISGLDAVRTQVITTADRLDAEFAPACAPKTP